MIGRMVAAEVAGEVRHVSSASSILPSAQHTILGLMLGHPAQRSSALCPFGISNIVATDRYPGLRCRRRLGRGARAARAEYACPHRQRRKRGRGQPASRARAAFVDQAGLHRSDRPPRPSRRTLREALSKPARRRCGVAPAPDAPWLPQMAALNRASRTESAQAFDPADNWLRDVGVTGYN